MSGRGAGQAIRGRSSLGPLALGSRDARELAYPLATLAVVAFAWEIAARAAASVMIPTAAQTMAATVSLLMSPELWDALWISNQALIIGFPIAVAIGIPMGLALGRLRTLDDLFQGYVTILLTVPAAGIIPLLVMSVGIGLEARVTVVVFFAVSVLIVNARAGVREVDPRLIEMARSFGASELLIWKEVLLPGSAAAVISAMRIGLGSAITGMVIVELLLIAAGIGYLILKYQQLFDAAHIYATVIIVVLEAVLLLWMADRLSQLATPWARRTSP